MPPQQKYMNSTFPWLLYCQKTHAKQPLSLAFNPSKSPNYKIVSMGSQIHVYSSETRAWKLSINKKSLQELELGYNFCCPRSVYWNGALIKIGKRCIISFDIEKECVKKLPMPSRAAEWWKVVYMGESGGKLQMIWSEKRNVFYISEMDSEGSWSPLSYRADLKLIMDLYPNEPICVSGPQRNRRRISLKPVHFFRGGEEGGGEDGVMLLSMRGRIVSYSLANKVFSEVCDLSSPGRTCDRFYDWHKFYSFGHTTFSP